MQLARPIVSPLAANASPLKQSSSHAARTLDDRFITYDRRKVHHKIRSFAQKCINRIFGQSRRTFLFL